jgi:transcriptional regulator with PAS, ATPase and Fis domain
LADVLDNVVATDTTVLLEGESGTGKSLLAETIHRFSQRPDGPLCGGQLLGLSGDPFKLGAVRP